VVYFETKSEGKNVPYVCTYAKNQPRAFGRNSLHNKEIQQGIRSGGGGIRTPSSTSNSSLHNSNKTHTKPTQKLAKTDTYKNHKKGNLNKTNTSSEQDHNNSLHKKCTICVHRNKEDSDLFRIVGVWPKLPEYVKELIMALTETYGSKE